MRKTIVILMVFISSCLCSSAQSWVRVNLKGYLPNDIKVAVLLSQDEADGSFVVCDAVSDDIVFKGKGTPANASRHDMRRVFKLDFSSLRKSGGYYIVSNNEKSPCFRISPDVYDGISDSLLFYIRQQRCGGSGCHNNDGFIVDHPTKSGDKVDVSGGWHDGRDYVKYITTSATTVYQLLFAYMEQKDKTLFKDEFDSEGKSGRNGVADILDEARWGLDWMLKMNPEHRMFFHQVGDDRDHIGVRPPQDEKIDYGWGAGGGRPVYFLTGKPQGLGSKVNRTTGVSSVAGKFASAFALGAAAFNGIDKSYSENLGFKAGLAYEYALEDLGVAQSAPLISYEFFEEDSYTDDLELAAATMMCYSGLARCKVEADYWGGLEPVSPWMELGRSRYYQYYPFINIGHYYLSKCNDDTLEAKYCDFMRMGLQRVKDKAADDPFLYGIPTTSFSNILISSAMTQALLYRQISSDESFLEMETAQRDWLFGCNPIGSVVIPTSIDGAASLLYYYSTLEERGKSMKKNALAEDKQGAVIRVNPTEKRLYLIFSADSLFNGASVILNTLKRHKVKASFFISGNCLSNQDNMENVKRVVDDGHYLGGYSGVEDVKSNFVELSRFDINTNMARWLLTPSREYSSESIDTLKSMGFNIINYTPGSVTNADATYPGMGDYRTSQQILNMFYALESAGGLKGAIILIHAGVGNERPDPFYMRLGDLIKICKKKGYSFGSFSDLTL